jgi:hypothetical protein
MSERNAPPRTHRPAIAGSSQGKPAMRLSKLWRTIGLSLAVAWVIGVPATYADTVKMRLTVENPIETMVFLDDDSDGLIRLIQQVLGPWKTDVVGKDSTQVGTPGAMSLAPLSVSVPTTTKLTVELTQFDIYSPTGQNTWQLAFGGTRMGAAVTYEAFVDDGNAEFGKTTSLGMLTFASGPTGFNGSTTGSAWVTGPYSLTQVITLQGLGSGTAIFSGSATLTPVSTPEPLTSLLLGIALLGVFGLAGRRIGIQGKCQSQQGNSFQISATTSRTGD